MGRFGGPSGPALPGFWQEHGFHRALGIERFDTLDLEVGGLAGEQGGERGEVLVRLDQGLAELAVSDAISRLAVFEAAEGVGGGFRRARRDCGGQGGAGFAFAAAVGRKGRAREGPGLAEDARGLRLCRVDTQEELLALEEDFFDPDLLVSPLGREGRNGRGAGCGGSGLGGIGVVLVRAGPLGGLLVFRRG